MSKSKNPNWQERPADFEFLVDSGLLFEINRTVLHPVGLALTLKKSPEGQVVLCEQLKDMRGSPEEAVYDPNLFEIAKQKLERFMREYGDQQITKREKKLGWGCQHFAIKRYQR